MSDASGTLKLEERTTLGKGLGAMRRDGMIPAVIHNHGEASITVMAPEAELIKVYRSAGKHHPLNLMVGSSPYLALIKDVHYNPAKQRMQHVVFQAIKQNEKVEAEIPLHLVEGEIPAEKMGLVILHQLDHVQVEAFPRDLPDQLLVDVTKLAELGDKITVGDLAVPSGVTILTEADHPIAIVAEPKVVEEEPVAEVAEGEEGAAEGETGESSGNETDNQETTQE